jgi:hypothetical protein
VLSHIHRSIEPSSKRPLEHRAGIEDLRRGVPQPTGREHIRSVRHLEHRRHRGTIKVPQVELVPARLVIVEDAPGRDQLGVVELLHEVGDALRVAGGLDLLVAVTEGLEDDGAVGLDVVEAVRPDEDAGDADRVGG